MAVAESPDTIGEVINIGSGKGISMGELARLIMETAEIEVEIESERQRVRPAGSEVLRLICSAEKASALIGWAPRMVLREGLVRTIEYIRSRLDTYKASIYNI